MRTAITDMLGIQYPILLGGLQWISRAEFVAEAANAGATGFIPAATFESTEQLTKEIRLAKTYTDNPFGVNISMLPEMPMDHIHEIVEVVLKENIPFVETAGRSPAEIIPRLKENGVKVIHKVTSPRHARSAERDGADAIVLVGYEGAGHPGMDQVGTFVNLPATIDAVDIPVIAAGGICDRKSFAAAMVLGAEGVTMGTRFLATEECPVHENYKQWVVDADITDTLIIQRSIRNAFRVIKNEKAYEVLGIEQTGAGIKELLPHISGKKGRTALSSGDLSSAVLTAGQCAGRIKEIVTVKELIEDMAKGLEEANSRLESFL